MKKIVKVEVLSIGSELLKNRTNTNILNIAAFLEKFNLKINKSYNVPDIKSEIQDALKFALNNSDLIFLTGGLGPTVDDITFEAAGELLSKKLIFKPEILRKIVKKLEEKNRVLTRELKQNLKKMAYVLEDALILDNKIGSAQGLILNFEKNKNKKTIVFLPGPPEELNCILENEISKYLKKENWLNLKNRVEKQEKLEFQTFGLPESVVDIKLKKILKTLKHKNVTISILIKSGVIYAGLFFEKDNKSFEFLKNLRAKIKREFEENILVFSGENVVEILVKRLTKSKETLAVAESCSGGLVGKLITDIPGSAYVFLGGIISYSNQVKVRDLKVREKTLEDFGAVSEETALEMANGALKKFGTDYAISITGIAGPKGATPGKPVGLVYIGIASRNFGTSVERFVFSGDRVAIRKRAAITSLAKLLKLQNRHKK